MVRIEHFYRGRVCCNTLSSFRTTVNRRSFRDLVEFRFIFESIRCDLVIELIDSVTYCFNDSDILWEMNIQRKSLLLRGKVKTHLDSEMIF